MSLTNERELINTRKKLHLLEKEYQDTSNDLTEDPRVRELSMHSLKQLINQLKEEIALFEVRQPAGKA